ncbi:cytochrome o ubiquinol oxidase subunit IV [Candidatus Saccharibacteria bacterium CG_4_10_14_0_2_um_filter_52_9]|nr:MAG: cytochrome o ubiquinol oxidase subunit IV [Candidatus Saccharibacteria bacterium CG_4_10_14_0_2_um_filter_52_9]
MSTAPKIVVAHHETARGSVKSYTTGFVMSLILTLSAYLLVVKNVFSGWGLVTALAALAITQLLVQLLFFLHLGRESKPRWNLVVLLFAVLVVAIVVFGSLWIMKNLQYNHSHYQSPAETDKFLIKDEGYQP